jgi:hypothetical protein
MPSLIFNRFHISICHAKTNLPSLSPARRRCQSPAWLRLEGRCRRLGCSNPLPMVPVALRRSRRQSTSSGNEERMMGTGLDRRYPSADFRRRQLSALGGRGRPARANPTAGRFRCQLGGRTARSSMRWTIHCHMGSGGPWTADSCGDGDQGRRLKRIKHN